MGGHLKRRQHFTSMYSQGFTHNYPHSAQRFVIFFVVVCQVNIFIYLIIVIPVQMLRTIF